MHIHLMQDKEHLNNEPQTLINDSWIISRVK